MIRLFIALAALAFLAGCKAKDVEVRVSTDDIEQVIAGEEVSVRFIARFETFGTMTPEQQGQLEAMQGIVEAAFDVDDYNVVTEQSKTTITVEGEMPFVAGNERSTAPFALHLLDFNNDLLPAFTRVLQVNTGKGFPDLKTQMQKVSFMLTIDDVQPLQYRLRNESGKPIRLLAGGAQVDGKPLNISAFSLQDGERKNITFKGGTFDSVPGGVALGLD